MAATNTITPVFDLTGGRLCLDFINTLDDRSSSSPQELLQRYSDLVTWSQQSGTVSDEEAQHLLDEAKRRPAEASTILERAIVLREAMFRIFSAATEDASPEAEDLDTLNEALAEAMSHASIQPENDGFAWGWAGKEKALHWLLWPVVRSGADILVSEELHAVRVCMAEDCNWLFLDTSKNRSRRWCNMKTCGNRAKVRRHYDRKKDDAI